jgi:hypothetical protein
VALYQQANGLPQSQLPTGGKIPRTDLSCTLARHELFPNYRLLANLTLELIHPSTNLSRDRSIILIVGEFTGDAAILPNSNQNKHDQGRPISPHLRRCEMRYL